MVPAHQSGRVPPAMTLPPRHPHGPAALQEAAAKRPGNLYHPSLAALPLLVLCVWLLTLLAARMTQWWPYLVPACGLKTLTGLPCPLCGSTRALVAWSRLDILQAFRWNPLVSAACVVLWLWLLGSLSDWAFRTRLVERGTHWIRRVPWLWLLGTAVLVNWIYLFFRLPS